MRRTARSPRVSRLSVSYDCGFNNNFHASRRIKKHLQREKQKTLYHAFINIKLSYASSLRIPWNTEKNEEVPQRTLTIIYDWNNPFHELVNMNNEVFFHQRHLWTHIKQFFLILQKTLQVHSWVWHNCWQLKALKIMKFAFNFTFSALKYLHFCLDILVL